ncbi:MAG: hypothetical protein ACYCZO_16995 [Daejeonella sp.]
MRHKITIIFKTTAVLITAVVFHAYGQTTSLGARFTTNRYPSARVENPSPSNIYGSKHLSIETGIYALRYFKNERVGMKIGLEFGLIPWDLGVDAPINAFGKGTGDGQINMSISFNDFSYKAITLSAAYKVPLKNRFLEIIAGASVRDYAFGNGDDGIWYTFNRSIRYDPDDPTQSPDINAVIKSLDDQFHISFPVSADYVFKTSKRTQFKVGLMHNIAIKPISDSELTVIMYGQTYKGKFSPRTSFWGFNVQFDYDLKKRSSEIFKADVPATDLSGKLRKALFVERHGSGIDLSVNYDMRLKKDVNDGAGVRAGIGIGRRYNTAVTNNNKSTARRYMSVPVGINYIVGKKRHGLEAGASYTAQIALDKVENGPQFIYIVPFNIGYRFQPIKEGLIARAAWTPTLNKYGFYAGWTGVSVGYSFR